MATTADGKTVVIVLTQCSGINDWKTVVAILKSWDGTADGRTVLAILTQSSGTVDWKTVVATLLPLRTTVDEDRNDVEICVA